MSADVPADVAAWLAANGVTEVTVERRACRNLIDRVRVQIVSVYPHADTRAPQRHVVAEIAADWSSLAWGAVRGYLTAHAELHPPPAAVDVARLQRRIDAALAVVLRGGHAFTSCADGCDCDHDALVEILRGTPASAGT